jgi:hypothetical protein
MGDLAVNFQRQFINEVAGSITAITPFAWRCIHENVRPTSFDSQGQKEMWQLCTGEWEFPF